MTARVGRTVARQRGQLAVFVVLMIAALIATSALVLDVGAWYREHRRLQALVDAAALAAAQKLPYDPSAATRLASEYADKNGGPQPEVAFPSSSKVSVRASREAPGFLARVVGSSLDSVAVAASAEAGAFLPSQAVGAVPLVVSAAQSALSGCGGPCFGTSTSLPVNDDETAGGGQMGMVDLRSGGDGSVTATQIAEWVSNGLSDPMSPNSYYTAAGSCKFSNRNFHQALDAKVAADEPLLFPVYDPSRTDTSVNPPRYYVVGWAAFVVTGYRLNGCGAQNYVTGYFTNRVIRGSADASAPTPDFGVRVVALTG